MLIRFSKAILSVIAFAFAMLAFSHSFGQADNSISLYDHDRLIKEYLKVAFSPQKQTLLKFTTWPIPTEITCEGLQQQDCRQGIDAVNQAVHVGISFNLDFKTKPVQLEFQFVPAEAVEERSTADSKLFAGGFMDKSDPDCQVFYSLRGSEIINAKLLVSVGQASLRKRLCIQVQLFKAMGLHAFGDETFAEQWVNKPLGVQDSTEADFGPGVHSYFIIEAIHACPQLHPGMKIDEARESLHADETCLAKFTTPEK